MTRLSWLPVLAFVVAIGCDDRTQPPEPKVEPKAAPANVMPSPRVEIPDELAKWAKEYPKTIPAKAGEADGAIEVFGDFPVPDGIKVLKTEVVYSPAIGGSRKNVEIKFLDGKFGALDPKDAKKVIPARVPLPKDEWQVSVWFTIEGKDAKGNVVTSLYATSFAKVEIK